MLFRLGILALILSFVPWIGLGVSTLLGGSLAVAGAAVVLAEVLFWVGLVLAGKDTWKAVRAHGLRRAPGVLLRLLVKGRQTTTTRVPIVMKP